MTIQLNSIQVGKGNTTVKEFLQLTQNLSEEEEAKPKPKAVFLPAGRFLLGPLLLGFSGLAFFTFFPLFSS